MQNSGRNDPIALLGQRIGNRSNQKKLEKAQERMAEGRTSKMDSLEGGLKWVSIVISVIGLRTTANHFVSSW